jgi:CheY-like chemotaxis protein
MMPVARPRVLVVEDNLLIAMEVQFFVEECGCAAVGPVATLEKALGIAQEDGLAGAILDINLGAERVWPLAETLAARKVPFLLATGYGNGDIPEAFKTRPHLAKPLTLGAIKKGLKGLGVIPP